MFNKMIKKFVSQIRNLYENEIEKNDIVIKNKNNVNIFIIFLTFLIFLQNNGNENDIELTDDIRNELKSEATKMNNKNKEDKKKFYEEKFSSYEKNHLTNKKRKREEEK